MKTWIGSEPEYIQVRLADQEARLIHYRLGQGQRRVLIIGGVHGWEHGGVQAAYELLKRLASMPLRGRIDILPVCNPQAYAAESRETPHSSHNMALCFTAGPPHDLTTALGQAETDLAQEAEMVLNLHSAGAARYLVHATSYRPQDAEWRRAGLTKESLETVRLQEEDIVRIFAASTLLMPAIARQPIDWSQRDRPTVP
jgi:predicted deacylase